MDGRAPFEKRLALQDACEMDQVGGAAGEDKKHEGDPQRGIGPKKSLPLRLRNTPHHGNGNREIGQGDQRVRPGDETEQSRCLSYRD